MPFCPESGLLYPNQLGNRVHTGPRNLGSQLCHFPANCRSIALLGRESVGALWTSWGHTLKTATRRLSAHKQTRVSPHELNTLVIMHVYLMEYGSCTDTRTYRRPSHIGLQLASPGITPRLAHVASHLANAQGYRGTPAVVQLCQYPRTTFRCWSVVACRPAK